MRPPVKSKNQGYARSGRGTGVPAAGAIGGGDGFQQKVGRPKRPVLSGDMGSPTQSADSGFSSALSRVNKGREKDALIDRGPMFPDQDPSYEEVDDALIGLRTRKLPTYFAGMKRIPESNMTRGFGKPSLAKSLLNEERALVQESFVDDLMKTASEISDAIGSTFGVARPLMKFGTKVLPGIASSVASSTAALTGGASAVAGSIPGVDVLYGMGAGYFNYRQISENLRKLDEMCYSYGIADSYSDLVSMDTEDFKLSVGHLLSRTHAEKEVFKEELNKMFGNFKDIIVAVEMMSDTLTGASLAGPFIGLASTAAATSAAIITSLTTDYEVVVPKMIVLLRRLPMRVKKLIEKAIRESNPEYDYDEMLVVMARSHVIYVALKHNAYEGIEPARQDYQDELEIEDTSGSPRITMDMLEAKKSKKKTLKREFSGAGAVAGFTGPLSGFSSQSRKDDFEDVAAKSFGGSNIDESAAYIVNGKRSIVKALLD
jgi:hypothetical protein